MIFSAFLRALSQGADPRFRAVLLRGVALSLGLLVALWVVTIEIVRWLTPDTLTLPWIGEVGGIDMAASVGSVALLLVASVVLMVPVASAFSGLFLERVAAAVEARHYPALPAVRAQPVAEAIFGAAVFLVIVIGANLAALLVWPFTGPFAPLLFWALNGWLLGREYFTLVALRHLPPDQAGRLYRANRATVWAAGTLMAAPLSVPLVNLLVPVLGVATFTHIFHSLRR
ncbi:EI24 domain-containing protein [Paragemmobacter straminiformis]|uniref:EI24 domain-containing protein n=1 Tax=Paragemmobacter straminiformis TaxID=2045119 RepID=A0A842IA34_9RHOB|nr:EI24 domain-containing protein [Gemmobacter straminiformis]MBC2836720.1 EI24 domain-containing protein [Gemmobacter straminiformis]